MANSVPIPPSARASSPQTQDTIHESVSQTGRPIGSDNVQWMDAYSDDREQEAPIVGNTRTTVSDQPFRRGQLGDEPGESRPRRVPGDLQSISQTKDRNGTGWYDSYAQGANRKGQGPAGNKPDYTKGGLQGWQDERWSDLGQHQDQYRPERSEPDYGGGRTYSASGDYWTNTVRMYPINNKAGPRTVEINGLSRYNEVDSLSHRDPNQSHFIPRDKWVKRGESEKHTWDRDFDGNRRSEKYGRADGNQGHEIGGDNYQGDYEQHLAGPYRQNRNNFHGSPDLEQREANQSAMGRNPRPDQYIEYIYDDGSGTQYPVYASRAQAGQPAGYNHRPVVGLTTPGQEGSVDRVADQGRDNRGHPGLVQLADGAWALPLKGVSGSITAKKDTGLEAKQKLKADKVAAKNKANKLKERARQKKRKEAKVKPKGGPGSSGSSSSSSSSDDSSTSDSGAEDSSESEDEPVEDEKAAKAENDKLITNLERKLPKLEEFYGDDVGPSAVDWIAEATDVVKPYGKDLSKKLNFIKKFLKESALRWFHNGILAR
eukprot:GHVU01080937.1.p1 GENE.GHVU01080937.1~~GHVU01080937.1.p1  ORF type:complete len:628 (+),score=57.85 GHVU01080937.1:257-1885(+)